jgi:hypothetical protein
MTEESKHAGSFAQESGNVQREELQKRFDELIAKVRSDSERVSLSDVDEIIQLRNHLGLRDRRSLF